jgi:RecG-like helicase
LQNRGAWEILGTRQSWQTDIPLEILSDIQFINKVQNAAKDILESYPKLEWLDNLKTELLWDNSNLFM